MLRNAWTLWLRYIAGGLWVWAAADYSTSVLGLRRSNCATVSIAGMS